MLVTADYVNEKLQGLDVKDSVVAASTTDIPGSYAVVGGLGVFTFATAYIWVLDGITVAFGDRVLLKNQTNNYNNGIYKITTLGTATVPTVLQRTSDADSLYELSSAFVFVERGNTLADTGWTCTISSSEKINVPPDGSVIPWTQFSGAGTYKADETSLHLQGNTFSIRANAVTAGAFTTGGALSVGTAGTNWTMQDTSNTLVFSNSGFTATLPAPSATRTTIAYTSDVPAGVDVIPCATLIGAVKKDITVANYQAAEGKQLYVYFQYGNNAASPTLSINSATALPLYVNGGAAGN